MKDGVLAQTAQPPEQWQVEEARTRQKEAWENLERRCRPLGVIVRTQSLPKSTYLITEAAETTAEIVLTGHANIAAIEARAREDWTSVVDSHLDTLIAMLTLGRIGAINTISGIRVQVSESYPRWALADLSVTRSDFEEFGRVVGIEFERDAKKEVRETQYDNMIDIIAALYELAAANKPPGQVRGIASIVTKMISRHTEGVDRKTVSRYLKQGKDRGFTVADEDWHADDESA